MLIVLGGGSANCVVEVPSIPQAGHKITITRDNCKAYDGAGVIMLNSTFRITGPCPDQYKYLLEMLPVFYITLDAPRKE